MESKYINHRFDAVALFSGGLDSILAARLIQNQGLKVLGLHFVSPFFGHPDKIEQWEDSYKTPIIPVDVSRDFISMLLAGPRYGTGKVLNPCVDCKILMLNKAKILMNDFGAGFIVSGEVLGQRPMSQRLDTLNIIKRDSQVKDILVRALSARKLPPTAPELSQVIDRGKLGSISGRGRKEQLKMAREFNINPIPTPAGGCLLTEKESAKRYLPVLQQISNPEPEEFYLANTGRQLWHDRFWLSIGRNRDDNSRLEELSRSHDYTFSLKYFPGPLGLGRLINGESWPGQIKVSACEMISSFSPKARKSNRMVEVVVSQGDVQEEVLVWPGKIEEPVSWEEPQWTTDKPDGNIS